jgi:autotransporter strand-loop-strand O-heptosyltransferase
MVHNEQRAFCEKVKEKYPNYFKNKKVLDIGSLDINGNNRTLFENSTYIGLDLDEGKNVDTIGIGHLYDAPNEYFDTIISTEVFEHDMFYEKTIENIIRMLKPGGLFLFTCAAPGRPEHGTRRTGGFDAPLLIKISEEWADYYKNLTESDVRKARNFNVHFPDGHFEYRNLDMEIPGDLYFYGIKGGSKYLIDNIAPEFSKDTFSEHIFVIDTWPDNESKENDLIGLIKILKIYNIPILLTGHYPIKPEIQKMVDFYLFDKNNPILINEEYKDYNVNSGRWSNFNNFHHDYAIWETMRNAFNFCKYLGKSIIHFLEYDNLPDPYQYRQTFMENIKYYDAVLYEYNQGSTIDAHLGPYCATFIFSIKTDIAIKLVDSIKNKFEYFHDKPKGFQLERNFLEQLKKVTNNIYVCEYIDNENKLNTQAVWNRDGMNRNGPYLQIYLAADDTGDLYLHPISGFHEKPADEDYLIEVIYNNYKKFHAIKIGEMGFYNLGKYKKGYTVRVFHQGIEIFNEFLGNDVEEFRKLNKLTNDEIMTKTITDSPKEININFIDGPFVEIKEDTARLYHVQFINQKNNHVEFELDLKSNHWAKASKKYFIKWIIKIKGVDNDFYAEHAIDATNKRVLISFESKALGDTIAWFPYVEKFRIDNKCSVICSTFHNNLFKGQYPNIEFVEPGMTVNNIYALYRIGVFRDNDKVDFSKHLTDPKKEPLTKVASDILGLDYEELRPSLPVLGVKKKKLVSIAVHGTAQCKYWNNPNGWQEVVDFLNNEGYEVRLLSREIDGYMGNRNPVNVTRMSPASTIEEIMTTIQESEIFIGISSGLAWVSWASGTETILISGFTDVYTEPMNGIRRIINKEVCNSCWNKYEFNPGDWNWCPVNKGTDREFECSKTITSSMVIKEIKSLLGS